MGNYKKIIWEDHFSDSAWQSREEIREWVLSRRKTLCVTIGEITHEDEDMVVVCSSFDGDDRYGECIGIFKGTILERVDT